MIVPDKHTDIKTSVPYIAGVILKEISANGIIKYDELKNCVTKKIGQSLGDSFEYGVCFLFLLNRINYNQSLDSFTLIA